MKTSVPKDVFSAGIFAQESGQRFLHILLQITHRGFFGLFERAKGNVTGSYYTAGLKRVHTWSNEVIDEDVRYVREKNPDVDETYATCFMQYVQERFGHNKRASATVPSVNDFTRQYFEYCAQHETMTSGEYFVRKDPVQQRLSCMDAARSALNALALMENTVKVELASTVMGEDSQAGFRRSEARIPSRRQQERDSRSRRDQDDY